MSRFDPAILLYLIFSSMMIIPGYMARVEAGSAIPVTNVSTLGKSENLTNRYSLINPPRKRQFTYSRISKIFLRPTDFRKRMPFSASFP